MGCLEIYGSASFGVPEHVYERSGPPTTTVWRPIFDHQLEREVQFAVLKLSEFNFSPVWLENACSRLQNGVLGI